jgi:putative tricarboxylic transport membrane protein
MMKNKKSVHNRDMASVVMACLFIIMGVVALWDTTNMMDSDSYVFPRAIAIAMILFSLALIVWKLAKPAARKDANGIGASNFRRIALVGVMLLSCLLMPWLGFLISGFATFFLLMLVAMYDAWTPAKKIIYPLIAVAVVLGFYGLFANLLQVPLPIGTLFE